MYIMQTFEDMVGKEIKATKSCLFRSPSHIHETCRALYHVTSDNGILLFGVTLCNEEGVPQETNVFASEDEIQNCIEDSDFQRQLLKLGIPPKDILSCIQDIQKAPAGSSRCLHKIQKKQDRLHRKLVKFSALLHAHNGQPCFSV